MEHYDLFTVIEITRRTVNKTHVYIKLKKNIWKQYSTFIK